MRHVCAGLICEKVRWEGLNVCLTEEEGAEVASSFRGAEGLLRFSAVS